MKLIDRDLFEQKRKELLDQFVSADAAEFSAAENPEKAAALDKELFSRIIDLYAIQRGQDPTNENIRASLESYARTKMATLDPDDPAAIHGSKLLRLLAGDQRGALSTYADALREFKKSECRKAQCERATGPRPTPYRQFLETLVRSKPTISADQALSHIKRQKLVYPIYDVCEEWIWVYKGEDEPFKDFPEYKRHKIRALGSNLAQVRKRIKKTA